MVVHCHHLSRRRHHIMIIGMHEQGQVTAKHEGKLFEWWLLRRCPRQTRRGQRTWTGRILASSIEMVSSCMAGHISSHRVAASRCHSGLGQDGMLAIRSEVVAVSRVKAVGL